jgi:hypothetical protein
MLGVLGCAAQAPQPPPTSEPTATLQLALTGVDDQAQQYRLRNATFSIYGYAQTPPYPTVDTSVSSEDDLDHDFLSTRLLPGNYTITLQNPDWYLERIASDGTAERVAKSVLLSAQSQPFSLYEGGTTQVYFTFGAGGDLIDFRHGSLSIGITVQRPTDDGTAGSAEADSGSDP